MDLYFKINQLFRDRKIDWLLSLAGDTDLREKLFQTQYLIYDFDKHLENNWNIDKSFYSKYNKSLLNIEEYCVPKSIMNDCILRMESYIKHELNIRKQISLSTIPIDQFYQTKFCDIYLIRSIIYHNYKGLDSLVDFNLWQNFDFLAEILDDIDDVEEDKGSFNGNRYLTCILENKSIQEYTKLVETKSRDVDKALNAHYSRESDFIIRQTNDLVIQLQLELSDLVKH